MNRRATNQAPFRQVRDDYADVLKKIAALGVTWRGTRWSCTFATFDLAASWEFPRDARQRRLFNEAFNQALQLTRAAGAWPTLDEGRLSQKLRIIAEGTYETPEGDDRPRNTLFELWCAAKFAGEGCSVSITEGCADVELSLEGFPRPIAIECKRPASKASIIKASRNGRRQLRERRKQGAGRRDSFGGRRSRSGSQRGWSDVG